jgi:hypothetical protein
MGLPAEVRAEEIDFKTYGVSVFSECPNFSKRL